MTPTLFVLSLLGGFCSGLLGVGGAVVLIPLLLAVPPLVGAGNLDMHQVAGVTMIQVLGATALGALVHRRAGAVHLLTVFWIGIPMGLLGFAGAMASKGVDARVLEIVFGGLVLVALMLLFRRSVGESDGTTAFTFSRWSSVVTGGGIGVVSGMIGAGGGFVLIPVMTSLLRIPMRVAVGSSLGIVFIGAVMGSAGKILTGQVEWTYVLPVMVGSLPASLLGARVSHRLQPVVIRRILLVLVAVILVRTWIGIFSFAG